MNQLILHIRVAIMEAGVTALAAIILWTAFGRQIAHALRTMKRDVCIFLVAAVPLMAFYAVSKHSGTITYYRTDADIAYFVDNGSYVTNDFVHVAYTTFLVPDSAILYVDRRPYGSTNESDWVTHVQTTVGEYKPYHDIQYANATNWNWIVYTTWTPGASVQTNGVLHVNCIGFTNTFISVRMPVSTTVKEDRTVIAPNQQIRSSGNVSSNALNLLFNATYGTEE